MPPLLPYLLEPLELINSSDQENILVIDMCKPEQYAQTHIPGAIFLNYANIVAAKPPIMGLLPEETQLQSLLSTLGITPNTHIVAYDDEGGGKAARLLWTLATVGHTQMSMLNGGFHAWSNEGFPMDANPVDQRPPVDAYPIDFQEQVIAEQSYIQSHLDDPNVVCLDARSEAEYSGRKKFAARAGHIPGAIHMDWMSLMDQTNNLRLKSAEQLKNMFGEVQIDSAKEVIVYCQTHHRSALSFVALTSLGYASVRGYPGSWSDWGNSETTPIE